MKWETKCWGRVRHLFSNSHAAVSHLEIESGWKCSCHFHEDRVNQFNVLRGLVLVELFKSGPDGSLVISDYHLLDEGGSFIVPAMVSHRFTVLRSGEMIEVYWTEDPRKLVRLDDIIRFDVGGKADLHELRKDMENIGYHVYPRFHNCCSG